MRHCQAGKLRKGNRIDDSQRPPRDPIHGQRYGFSARQGRNGEDPGRHLPAAADHLGAVCIVYLVLAPVIAFRFGPRMLQPDRWVCRSSAGVHGMGHRVFYWAVRYIPLASTTSIYFLAPLVVTALSPLVLKERVDLRRWIAVVIGFLG